MKIPFQINSCGRIILGILHAAQIQNEIPLVVIMCYGLNGNRVEQHRMSVKLGEICELNSINLIRFDYVNTGISEGDFFFSNTLERIKNVIDVYTFIKGCFNSKIHVYLVGFSDGAKIAIQAKEYIIDFCGFILWNPMMRISGVAESASNRTNKLLFHKRFKKPYKALFGVCLNMGLVREIENDETIAALDDKINQLLIFGEQDRYTKNIREYIESKRLANTCIKVISNAGHLFNSVDSERQVNEYTVAWIKDRYYD